MDSINWLQVIATGGLAGVFAAGSMWGMMRLQLKHNTSEVRRAHKRLDIIGAPNVTE